MIIRGDSNYYDYQINKNKWEETHVIQLQQTGEAGQGRFSRQNLRETPPREGTEAGRP